MNKTYYNSPNKLLEKKLNIDSSNDCNLSIIGYSSKLFRDDDRASEIDIGRHLIAWMGNEDIQIDRYDVRSYINDLSECETEDCILSEEDKEMEKMCDKERYRALRHDEEEIKLYEEEEQKRTNPHFSKVGDYSQVPYQYEDSDFIQETTQNTQTDEGESVTVMSNPLVNLPPNVAIPNSSSMSKIIEKTAKCVAKHGRQMEVLIKTRQAENEVFNFLTVGNNLNPYYEYMLEAIKSGYHKTGRNDLCINMDHDDVKTFSINVQPAPNVSDVDCTLTEDCPYNMLVNKVHQLEKNKLVG